MLGAVPGDASANGVALERRTVAWAGTKAVVRNEKVVEAMARAKAEEVAMEQNTHRDEEKRAVSMYDKIFIAYNDAIRLVQNDLEDLSSASSGVPNQERMQEQNNLLAYLTNARLRHTIQRNLMLVNSLQKRRGDLAKPEDLVRMYDNLIQNVTDILALPGVTGSDVETEMDDNRRRFRAYRCRFLAQSYMSAEQFKEATALFRHAASLAPDDESMLRDSCRAMRCRCIALQQRRVSGVADEVEAKLQVKDTEETPRPLLEMRDAFVSTNVRRDGIVKLPPALTAVACRPVLFDIAVDGVVLPEYSPATELNSGKAEKAADAPTAASSVFNWFSRKR
eukprot:Plantae.Rhodophyta-Rhodochaete_pulchella.ctg7140.p1 GENE.Plantae.Rhodophyta-Rhodochaete_pulchella.ctg7140~~Plantae.Rhodophyta-Rhodochaete_pulchella.ctg7140.p1  ORF type:complete len:387 (-),score=71.64 Plantae.Rhodophyta-Rhodochaete_pulchella.ctg7140:661-1671(-)